MANQTESPGQVPRGGQVAGWVMAGWFWQIAILPHGGRLFPANPEISPAGANEPRAASV